MQDLSNEIIAFLERNHVVSIAVCDADNGLWAASSFYVFDPRSVSLFILGHESTRHARTMLHNPRIAGTIAGQPLEIRDIQGVQFDGQARLLEGEDRGNALRSYAVKFPVAHQTTAGIWCLRMMSVKYTSNVVTFGNKLTWVRP